MMSTSLLEHVQNRIVRQVGYLLELYRDARSQKYEILHS